MSSNFKVCSFSVAKRKRAINACKRCRKFHRKCETEVGESKCKPCAANGGECIWNRSNSEEKGNVHSTYKARRLDSEERKKSYEKVLERYLKNSTQYVCATEPLAPLLSKDAFLCFEGNDFGLYYPWRGFDYSYENKKTVDKDLKNYITSRGGFVAPPIEEQRRLLYLYLDKVYPVYPVIDRNFTNDIKNIPMLLLNAMLLSAIKYDTLISKAEIRSRANTFYERCKLLELVEKNKVTLIQSYLLLSLHEEGIDGANNAKNFVTKACALCDELAITNLSGSNNVSNFSKNIDNYRTDSTSKYYGRSLFKRLFWVSLCCDRFTAATSGRAMFYNLADILVDEIAIHDFDEGDHQLSDFETLKSWCSLSKLVDCILCTLYRPPEKRTLNNSLKADLLDWKIQSSTILREDFVSFLKISHLYCCMLYFRCQVDLFTLMSNDEQNSASITMESNTSLVHKFCFMIIDLVSIGSIHHIIVVHALLHVIALLKLELNAKSQFQYSRLEGTANDVTFVNLMKRAVSLLSTLKDFWWYADVSVHLCNPIISEISNGDSANDEI